MLVDGITGKTIGFYKGTRENLEKFLGNEKLYEKKQRVEEIYLIDGYKLFFIVSDDDVSQESIVDNSEENMFLKE